jgi:ethanolamine ammonia-lyase small subunit
MKPSVSPDLWTELRRTTQARIGLGMAGRSLPTARSLELQSAHASARDAVHEPLDVAALRADLQKLGATDVVQVHSLATSRGEYLRRPDLGRQAADLGQVPHTGADVGIVLADGLSPRAVAEHAPALVRALWDHLEPTYRLAPPVIATQARVALGDHVGQALGVETVLVLIGERPGLSVANSLGVYLTHHPRPGLTDADRNCVSNIHPPEGLGYDEAAATIASLLAGARELGCSGVRLKNTRPASALTPPRPGRR